MAQLGGLLRKVTNYCFPDPIREFVEDEAVADIIRGEQMLEILSATSPLMATNALCILVTSYVVAGISHVTILFGWVVVGLLLVIGGIAGTWKFALLKYESRPTKSSFKAVYNATLLGAFWGALPLLFFADAQPEQRIFITCMIAGMMGGAVLSLAILPAAAAAMCYTIGAGAMLTLLMTREPTLYLASIMLVTFIFAIMQSARTQGRRFVRFLVDSKKIA